MACHSACSTEEDKGMRQCAVNVISVCRSKGGFEFPPRCFSLFFFFFFYDPVLLGIKEITWPLLTLNENDLKACCQVCSLFFWTAESLSSFKSLFSNFSWLNVLLHHISACGGMRDWQIHKYICLSMFHWKLRWLFQFTCCYCLLCASYVHLA